MGACQGAICIDAPTFHQANTLIVQIEAISAATHCRHCIGHQHSTSAPFCPHRGPEGRRVRMVAVGDDPEPTALVFQCGADDTGFTTAHRGHPVVQVSESAEPRVQRCTNLFVAGGSVPCAYHHAGRRQPGDYLAPGDFRCQGNQGHATLKRGKYLKAFIIRGANTIGVVDARALAV